MRFTCCHCGEPMKVEDVEAGDLVECPHCEASAPVPAVPARKQGKRNWDAPIVVPVMMPAEDDADLAKERRRDLRQRRRYRHEDRLGNPIGIAGFAIAATTLLLLGGGVLMFKVLPIYLWVVAVLSVPTSLVGLVLSIVGCLLVGRPRVFSAIGVGIGAFLILAGVPLSFLLLKSM